MSEFSQFKSTPSSSPIDVKDAVARQQLQSTKTATGNPITLTDAAPINAESLVVKLEPKQDLHGQSAPYVGGAGKNKLPSGEQKTETVGNLTVTCDGKGIYTINGYTGENSQNVVFIIDDFTILDSQNATLYLMNNAANSSVYFRFYNSQTMVDNFALTPANRKVSYTSMKGSNCTSFMIYVLPNTTVNNLTLSPMICDNANETTFAPYSNICPITGYTECEVDDVGKNLIDPTTLDLYDVTGTGTMRAGYAPIKLAAGTYTVSWASANTPILLTNITDGYTYETLTNGGNFTLNSTSEIMIRTGATSVSNVSISNIQLEKGSTATQYEPYRTSSATIQFEQTVYGGRSNLTDGGTDDEFESVDLGELSWNKVATVSGKWRFEAALYDFKKFPTGEVGTFKCSGYPTVSASDTWQGTFGLSGNGNYNSICVCDMSYSDATTFQTAMNGTQLVYEKATPTTISTPPTDLKLLQGTNNITTNGTTINLGYQPDNVVGELKGDIQAITEMDYLRILDNNVDTPINNYRIYYHLISGAYTLVNMGEMLNHRFIFVEVVQNPSGGVNKKVLHSALVDPRTIDGFEYIMKASGNDNIWIESILDENKFNLSLRTTGGSYSDGDPTDYYVTIRMVD